MVKKNHKGTVCETLDRRERERERDREREREIERISLHISTMQSF